VVKYPTYISQKNVIPVKTDASYKLVSVV